MTIPKNRITPFVLETMGAWGKHAEEYVKQLAIKSSPSHSMKDSEYSKHLRYTVQQVSFALQLGNAMRIRAYVLKFSTLRAGASAEVTAAAPGSVASWVET